MITDLLLCTPTYFDIEYSINAWMDLNNKVNKARALEQWNHFIEVLESLNVKVQVIDGAPGLPDMTFAGDCGCAFDGTFLASNFKHRERQPEREHYVQWMIKHGYNVVELPNNLLFEGLGDIIYSDNKIVFGYGPRSSKECLDWIKSTFPQVEVLAEVKIKDDTFFHLAMAAGMLDAKTIIYYPPAFSVEDQKIIQRAFPNALAAGEEDAREHFVCNNVVIGRTVLLHDCTKEFELKLKNLDFNVVRCDVSEFKKSGASLRCLVLNI